MLRIVAFFLTLSIMLVAASCKRDLTVGSPLDAFLVGSWEGSGGRDSSVQMVIVFDANGGATIDAIRGKERERFDSRYRGASDSTILLEPYAGLVRVERLSDDSLRFQPMKGAISDDSDILFQLIFHRRKSRIQRGTQLHIAPQSAQLGLNASFTTAERAWLIWAFGGKPKVSK